MLQSACLIDRPTDYRDVFFKFNGLSKKNHDNRRGFFESGSLTWARTRDTRINSPLLYRLSYQGIADHQLVRAF